MKRKLDNDLLYNQIKDICKQQVYWECPLDKKAFIDNLEDTFPTLMTYCNRHAKMSYTIFIHLIFYTDRCDIIVDNNDDIDSDDLSIGQQWKEFTRWCKDRYSGEEREDKQKLQFMSRTLMDCALEFSKRHPAWSLRTIPGQTKLEHTGLDVSDPFEWIFKIKLN